MKHQHQKLGQVEARRASPKASLILGNYFNRNHSDCTHSHSQYLIKIYAFLCSSRVRTLASLRQDSDSDDSGNEEGQAFYAGGSDSSGQQILGPSKNKGKGNREELVAQMFKSVKE